MLAVQARRAEGAALLAVTRVGMFGMGSVVTIVVARLLGPSPYGILSGAQAITAVLGTFGIFGVDQLLLARRSRPENVWSATQHVAVGYGLIYAAAGALWPTIPFEERLCVAVLGFAFSLDIGRAPWTVVPWSSLDFRTMALRETIAKGIVALALLLITLAHPTPLASALAFLVASTIVLALSRRGPGGRPATMVLRSRLAQTVRLIREGVPFSLSGALYTIYVQIDVALLASLAPARQVALYALASSFFNAATVLAIVLHNDILRARVTSLGPVSLAKTRMLARSLLLALGTGILGAAGFIFLSRPLVHLLLGARFAGAIGLAQILGLALPFHFLNSWAGNLLIARRHVHHVVWVQAAVALLNIGANLAFIPTYGAHAAAWISVVTEGAALLLYGLVFVSGRHAIFGDSQEPLS